MMRPLKLVMQAFGPYAGKEEIDFSKLENQTMFVISGKTGSGKTTIFDGISYAIYGKASGDDRTGPDLRSQFASDEQITEVELVFTLRNQTYVIWRSPQQLKKKERGDGYTTITAKAELFVLNESGEKQLLAANVRDVDTKINELMQIDSNQFRQIVMIPQGEFRKLLTSDSKDKEVILQRLFRTELYKRIEEKLKEEAATLRRTVEQQINERTDALNKIHVVHNDLLKEELANDTLNDQVILSLLNEEIILMGNELAQLSKEIEINTIERNKWTKKLLESEEVVKQLDNLKKLKEQKSKLEGDREKYTEKETELVLARKSSLLQQQELLCHRLRKDVDDKTSYLKQLEVQVTRLTSLLQVNEQVYEQEKAREHERNAKIEQINRLKMMHDDVYSFDKLQRKVTQLQQQLHEMKKQQTADEKRLHELDELLKQTQSEKEMIEKGQLRFVENERTLDKLQDEYNKLIKFEIETSKLTKAKMRLTECNGKLIQVVAHFDDGKALVEQLDNKWKHGQAAILASNLSEGCACPVCGSVDHPRLANGHVDQLPNEADLKAAKNDLVQLEKEKQVSERQFIHVQSEVDLLEQSVAEQQAELMTIWPEFTEENLDVIKTTVYEKQASLQDEQKKLAIETDKLSVIISSLTKLSEEQTTIQSNIKNNEQRLQTVTNEYTTNHTRLTRLFETIPETIRTVQAYEQVLKAVTTEWKKMNQELEKAQLQFQQTSEQFASERARLEVAEKQLTEVTEELEKERTHFKEKMKEQGFPLFENYQLAKRTDQQITTLENDIRQFREELRSVSDRYRELAVLLANVQPPNLAELKHEIEAIDQQMKDLQSSYTNMYVYQSANKDISQQVTKLNEYLAKLESRYELIGHLSDMARGQNALRMTFERFVLAAFLDDILMEANVRLSKMTSGRYQLLRKTDRSKGNVQSGLELLIFDQYTGQERHVKTLSGGESFKASLSLALGLADIVQQYAGGVSLETMFIDEGFGTLDPESLDQAIESLVDIQSSGRLVGIISHVPELKDRIDARIEVIATQTGSRTEFHFLNG